MNRDKLLAISQTIDGAFLPHAIGLSLTFIDICLLILSLTDVYLQTRFVYVNLLCHCNIIAFCQ